MRWTSLFAALAALFILAGCTGGKFSEKIQAGKENVFRYPIHDDPTTLDPGLVQDGDTIDALQQVFEGLVAWGENNEVVPRIAEKWEVQDEGKTYVFTLRKGVKFHNGREVTAEDIKWTIERNTSKELASPTWQYLADVVGMKEHHEGRPGGVSGIEVKDPQTLVIRIDKPRPYFLGKLTYLISAPMAKEAIPANAQITDIEQMVGAGPFKASKYERGQLLVLDANQDYFEGAPLIAQIERPIIKDPATRLNKYKSGELDLVMLQRQDIEALKADSKFASQLKPFDRPAIWYVGMNSLAYPPFKDPRVRKAFAMAIDKKRIVDELLGGANTIANSIVPPGVPGHREDAAAIPFDPAGAKRLLAEAGFPDAKGLPPLEMNYREALPDIRIVAEAVISMLKENLGVEINPRQMEWGAYLQKWNKGEMQIFHMRWAADYLDPENFLSYMLATYGPENKIGYNNAKFDELCTKADSIMDFEQRKAMYAEAEDIALQEAPWVPIYFQRDFELISERVSGLRESLFGHLPHTKVKLGSTAP